MVSSTISEFPWKEVVLLFQPCLTTLYLLIPTLGSNTLLNTSFGWSLIYLTILSIRHNSNIIKRKIEINQSKKKYSKNFTWGTVRYRIQIIKQDFWKFLINFKPPQPTSDKRCLCHIRGNLRNWVNKHLKNLFENIKYKKYKY